MQKGSVAGSVLVAALVAVAGCGRTHGSGEAAADGAANAASTRTARRVNGTFTGLYVDLEEGPLFTGCETGQQWHVQPGGPANDLDQAYLAVRSAAGEAIRVTLEAHSGARNDDLVVDKVVIVSGESVCPGQEADMSLTGTTWRMVTLGGAPLDETEGAVTLRLDEETRALQAYTACRSMQGTFRWTGTQLTFGGIDAGDSRCTGNLVANAASTDASILEVLRSTGSYRIRGDTLDLMGPDGVLARFAGEG